jgi:hypothetical protein
VFRGTAMNFNPEMAKASRICIAEVCASAVTCPAVGDRARSRGVFRGTSVVFHNARAVHRRWRRWSSPAS